MTTYVLLMKASERGAFQQLRLGSETLTLQRRMLKRIGAKVVSQYMVLGDFDCVAVIEVENEGTCLAACLSMSAFGLTATAMGAISEASLRAAQPAMGRALELWQVPNTPARPKGVSKRSAKPTGR